MIIREFYETRTDGIDLYRSYSDQSVYIRKDGTEEVYADAIDIDGAPFVYVETDVPIGNEYGEATEEDYRHALEEMGVTFNEEEQA